MFSYISVVFLSIEGRANIVHSQTSFNLVTAILQLEKYGYRASEIPTPYTEYK